MVPTPTGVSSSLLSTVQQAGVVCLCPAVGGAPTAGPPAPTYPIASLQKQALKPYI